MPEDSDLELLQHIAAGGRHATRAWSRLYDRYVRRFYAFLAVRSLSKQDAEDVIHDTFVQLCTRNIDTSKITSAPAYLWRCLRNSLTDFHRRGGRTPISVAGSDQDVDEEGKQSPLSIALQTVAVEQSERIRDTEGLNECLAETWECFRRDHEKRADAIYLAIVEGWSGQEMASYLGRTYGAAREYVSQCRKRFTEYFTRFCADYVPGVVST